MKLVSTSPFSDTYELDDVEVTMEKLPKSLSRSARYLYLEIVFSPADLDPADPEAQAALVELWNAGLVDLNAKELP